MNRKDFLSLPIEKRQTILAGQAEKFLDQQRAEDLSQKKYSCEFDGLSPKLQRKVFAEANRASP